MPALIRSRFFRFAAKRRPSKQVVAISIGVAAIALFFTWRYVAHYCAVQVVWSYGGVLQYEGGDTLVNVAASRELFRKKSGETLYKQFAGPVKELRFTPFDKPLPRWVIGQFPDLVFLSLNDVEASELRAVGELENLEFLVLHAEENLDAGMEHIQKLKKLQSLRINGPQSLSDAGCEKLSSLPALTALLLETNLLTNEGLQHLSNLPLEDLIISSFQVTDEGLHHLHSTPLHFLSIEGTSVSNDGVLELLRTMPGVDVYPETRAANPEHAEIVESLHPWYEFASDDYGKVTGVGISSYSAMDKQFAFDVSAASQLAKLPDLREAYVEGDAITDEVAPLLGQLKALEELTLSATTLGPSGVKALAAIPRLSSIEFEEHSFTPETISSLATLPQLETLSFLYVDFSPGSLEKIGELDSVAKLSFQACELTDEALETLELPARTKSLELNTNNLTDKCIPKLKTFKNLNHLVIYYNDFGEQAVAELQAALPNCTIESDFSDEADLEAN